MFAFYYLTNGEHPRQNPPAVVSCLSVVPMTAKFLNGIDKNEEIAEYSIYQNLIYVNGRVLVLNDNNFKKRDNHANAQKV